MDGSAATAQHDARAHKLSRCCSTQRARDLAETIPGTHPNLNRGQDTRANRTRYLDTFKLWGPRKARPVYCRVNTSPLLRDKRSQKRHCPSAKQRAVGKERCLLDRPIYGSRYQVRQLIRSSLLIRLE